MFFQTKPYSAFRIILVCLFIFCFGVLQAQSKRPKIGLVLSGGGAKGIAHVRVLQVLDSLGIVPDYIAGTSMGSIVGGLYAMGYSGNQIDSITQAMPWDKMFSNSVSFDEINIEEKDEFGRYIYELPLNGLKPQLPMGLVEGQHIEEMLARLFFLANSITDFNMLPTPFLCVAADIVKGEPVILNSGSLITSVRASMSIPTVFPPVRIGERLLVDGGVFMNLPVTYCRNMGADFIIAVDVGGGLYKEEELTSAASLLVQTTFLAGNLSYREERGKSDIFVDVVKHLKFGTMDFEQGATMMMSGDQAVKEVMPQLVSLSNSVKTYSARKKTRLSHMSKRYKLDVIAMEGVSDLNKDLVLEKFGWNQGDVVNRDQVASSVHELMGTRLFNKVSYIIEGDSVRSSLTIQAKEKPSNAAKFAIHYDTDRGAGLVLNFTKRNILIKSSRLVTTLDLAENPRARANYFYYMGQRSKWWHHNEFYGERVILNSFISGTPVPDVVSNYLSLSSQAVRTVKDHSMLGMGLMWQWNQLQPKVDPRTQSSPDSLEIINYHLRNLGARIFYMKNTFDKVFFPTKGNWFRAEVKYNFDNPFDAHLYYDSLDAMRETSFDGRVESYVRLNFKGQRNITINKGVTLQLIGQVGLTQAMFENVSEYSPYSVGAGDFISVGGQLSRPRSTSFTFVGLREGELSVPQVMMMGAQVQFNPIKNLYFITALNVLAAGYDAADFWKTLGDFEFGESTTTKAFYQFGYGFTSGYMSPIGPIQFTLANDSQIGKLRAFLSIGFTL